MGVGLSARMPVVPSLLCQNSCLSCWNSHGIFLSKLFDTEKCKQWLLRYKGFHYHILLRIFFSNGWDNGQQTWKLKYLYCSSLLSSHYNLWYVQSYFFAFRLFGEYLLLIYYGNCLISKFTKVFSGAFFLINASNLLWIVAVCVTVFEGY